MTVTRGHDVWLERTAERNLERLSNDNFHRVVLRIKALSKNPRPSGCRKITGSANDWRVRVGDYRVIYEIDDKKKSVKVLFIKHRKDAYR
ncbi:MAG TPA: type II toxin-antitoxin system RelE/ParE family toxin [Nitrospirae bacterium]|nr:type II toxin-antitoxin system RelE/ParE family toxin [Nitrospirota bacterium]